MSMKLFTILFLMLAGLFPEYLAKAQADSAHFLIDGLQTESLTMHDVASIQVVRLSGKGPSRLFQKVDGYQERVIEKVIGWINSSMPIKGVPEVGLDKSQFILKIAFSNKDVAIIEPAYRCNFEGIKKTCTIEDGQIVYTRNHLKIRLISHELYDWLLVGWKHEIDGPSKEELLEETLYAQYFSEIGKAFPDFIMCPRIDRIERLNGDTRRHFVHASALNYAGHHASSYDKINVF